MSTFRSLRFRAALLICGFTFFAVLASTLAAYRETRDAALLAARGRLKVIPAQLSETLGKSVRRTKLEVRFLAQNRAVVHCLEDPSSSPAAALGALSSARAWRSEQARIVGTELWDAAGHLVAVTDGPLPDRPGAVAAGLAQLQREPGSAVITPLQAMGDSLVYAVVDRVKAGEATLGYVVRWRRLGTAAQTSQLIEDLIGSDAHVYLANTRGDYWSDLSRRVPARPIDLARRAGVTTFRRPEGGDALAGIARVSGSPWTVLVEIPVDAVLAAPHAVLRYLAIFGLLLLAGGAVTAWMLSGRLTRWIVALADAATAISEGDYDRRTSIRPPHEVGALVRAFNRMADRVAASRQELHEKIEQLAESEAEHRQTRMRLEHVVTSSRAVLYTLRLKGRQVTLDWISDNAERELGYRVEEILTPGWWEGALHPDDSGAGVPLDRMPVDGIISQLYRLRRADCQYHWIRDEQRVLRDERGEAVQIVGVLSDVTEQRRLEVEKETAEAASRAKSEFLSRMSHELRTPLNAILGFGQLLELDLQTEENRESVDQILGAGKHLLALIDEVLDIARIEAGQQFLSVEPVRVGVAIRESVDLVHLSAAKQGIRLLAPAGTPRDLAVLADRQRLKQVLLNLLSNAIKYNRPDGTVTLACDRVGEGRLRITVTDMGYGIPEEKQERLFTPFDRLGADQTGVEGTGLGLALSRGLVEAMGGELGAKSRENEGSSFWVELPAAPATEPVGAAPDLQEVESPEEMPENEYLVLFIEDNLANVRLTERIFQRRPHVRLLTAMQGRRGLELAQQHRPHFILLDLNLPDIAGDEVLIQLRRDPDLQDVPIVMISGDAIPSQVRRLLELGAQGYVTKPFNVQELLALVDDGLRRQRVEQPA